MAYSNLLFVDEDFWYHVNNCNYLRDCGLNVMEAYSTSEATMYIRGPKRLTALVTDIDLGNGADGFRVARRARAVYPDLPVVYMSGAGASSHRDTGVKWSEYVSKPFNPQRIVEALGRATHLEAA